MKEIKLGLQLYSVREAFAEDPIKTLKRVKEMGYTGVEFPMGAITDANEGLTDQSAAFYKNALEEIGLECYGILASWRHLQPDTIQETIKFNKEVGSSFLVIGSVPTELVSNIDDAKKEIAYMRELHKMLNAEGIVTGYHNHDSDFFNVVEGKTFFEHVFDNTPEDFVMLLDTGNARAGGFDSIELLKKYPGRSPFFHIKGHSDKDGYLACIGQDDFDWEKVIDCAINIGGAKVFDIEFGQRGDYDPFERAETSLNVIKGILEKM